MDESQLLDRFQALSTECSGAYQGYLRSTKDLWRALVRIYLWWHDCSKIPGALDRLYEKHEERFQRMENRPNFNPLLRIAFGRVDVQVNERVRLSSYHLALNELHNEHTINADKYQHNPEGELLDYFSEQGGVNGIVKEAVEGKKADQDPEDNKSTKTAKGLAKTISDKARAKIKDKAVEIMKTAPSIGELKSTEPLRIGKGNLIALLARKSNNGKPELIASSNDAEVIALLAQSARSMAVSHLTPNLRVLVEIVRSQMYPTSVMPKLENGNARANWWRKFYADQSKVKTSDLLTWDGKTKPTYLNSAKKLLVRGTQGDIILSGSKLGVSVVTRCKLKSAWVGRGELLYLRVMDRAALEHMIETSETSIVTANPKSGLAVVQNKKYSRELVLANRVERDDKRLHFYDARRDNEYVGAFQSYFDFDSWQPQWSCTVSQRWFAEVREITLDEWFEVFATYNQPNREANRAMYFEASEQGFKLHYELNFTPGKKIPYDDLPRSDMWHGASAGGKTMHLSKDLAPVLINLAAADIIGNVKMSGDAHALVFEYKTKSGSFSIAVPTAERISENEFPRVAGHFAELHYD